MFQFFPNMNKKRYDSELPYQKPDLIEVMKIEIDLTTSTNVHTLFLLKFLKIVFLIKTSRTTLIHCTIPMIIQDMS